MVKYLRGRGTLLYILDDSLQNKFSTNDPPPSTVLVLGVVCE